MQIMRYIRDEFERLATEAIARLAINIEQPKLMAPLRREARRTAETMFASGPASEFLDALCERVAMERTNDPARLDPALDSSSPQSLPLVSGARGAAMRSLGASVASAT